MLTLLFLTAVPALQCPLRAFGEPSWTCSSTHPHVTAVPVLRCPPRAFGEPSKTCSTIGFTNHSSPGVTLSFSAIRRAKEDMLHATGHESQQSRRYGVLLGHSASQAGHAPLHESHVTAIPALRCPLWAFGEPSRTYFTPRVTSHHSPGVTVSSSGIRRAKLDMLHSTNHASQQSQRYGVRFGHSASQARRTSRHGSRVTAVPALRCPPRAFGEPSRTCSTPRITRHSNPSDTVSALGIRQVKQDILHSTLDTLQQSRRYGALPAFGEPSRTCFTVGCARHKATSTDTKGELKRRLAQAANLVATVES